MSAVSSFDLEQNLGNSAANSKINNANRRGLLSARAEYTSNRILSQNVSVPKNRSIGVLDSRPEY